MGIALAAICWPASPAGNRTDRTNLAAVRAKDAADLPLARGRAAAGTRH